MTEQELLSQPRLKHMPSVLKYINTRNKSAKQNRIYTISGGSMSNETGEKKLQDAFERLKKGETNVVPVGSKINVSNVEQEAGMGDGSAYYYPELIDAIKEAKKHVPPNGRCSPVNKQSSLNKKNRDLAKRNEELISQNKQILTAQAELFHQMLKQHGATHVLSTYKSTSTELKVNRESNNDK